MAKKRKKNKTPYYIASAMAVLAAASVGLMFYSGGLPSSNKSDAPDSVSETQKIVSEDATGLIQKRVAMEYPLMKTELEDLYVSANPYGEFTFYDYANGEFTQVADVQEKDITVTCSHQDIPTKLYYVERNGSVSGYGLFLTTLFEEDVRLYEYALFRLTDMPAGYGSGKMLLVDFDSHEFPFADKAYTEVFSFDLGSGKATPITSDNGRTVDNYARLRTDWAQMNNALLSLGGEKLYLSGRNYQLDSNKADIIYNADTSNTKPKWLASGIWENWMHTENGVLYYAKETENGFELFSMKTDGTETKLGSYAGGTDSYLFSGDYLLEKNTFALKRISTDENKDVSSLTAEQALSALNPTLFSVSPDGNRMVILCDGETQTALLVDLQNKKHKVVQDSGLFTIGCDSIQWLSDGKLMTIAETGNGYENLFWNF